jgi:hypothetical protein
LRPLIQATLPPSTGALHYSKREAPLHSTNFQHKSAARRRRQSRRWAITSRPPRFQTPASAGRARRSGPDIRISKPSFGFDSRGLIDERPPSSAGIGFRSAVLLISHGKSFRNSKGQVACGR